MSRVRQRRQEKSTVPIELGHSYIDYHWWSPPSDWRVASTFTVTEQNDPYEEVCIDDLHRGPPYKSGGPFSLVRIERDNPTPSITVQKNVTVYEKWDVKLVSRLDPAQFLSSDSLVNDRLADSYGATGWNKFRPVHSAAGLGQFLGEFKDVPRTLRDTALRFRNLYRSWKPKRGASSRIGKDWLTYQFGWLPFVSDIRDFIKTCNSFDKRLRHLREYNGRWHKRGGVVSSESETNVVFDEDGVFTSPILPTTFYQNLGGPYEHGTVTKTCSDLVWFEGSFRYWIPTLGKFPLPFAEAAIIFGAVPSPELLWELMPWSWLIDWAANVGSVVGNLSDSLLYGTTASYAYIMRTYLEQVSSQVDVYLKDVGTVGIARKAERVSKARSEASPFGFGLTGADFSAWQLSILAALGLSRLKYGR